MFGPPLDVVVMCVACANVLDMTPDPMSTHFKSLDLIPLVDFWTRVVSQAADVLLKFGLAGLLPGGVVNEFLPATCLSSA